VFHNTLKYLWQLGKDARFAAVVDVHHAEVLMAAALLHDLGHWPFCHPIEDMDLPDLPPHEEFAAEFLTDGGELAGVLRSEWQVEPAEVLDVIAPRGSEVRDQKSEIGSQRSLESADLPTSDLRPPTSEPLSLLRSILSGPIDVDKMDYLDRDSLHCGVPYGRNFDKNRLIQSLVVNAAGDGLAITSKGKTAAELMVFARYVMFSEVYWHHAVRSATAMFARAFFDIHGRLDLREFFQKREPDSIDTLCREAVGTNCERLTNGIFGPKRALYKRVGEFSHYQSREMYERLARRPYDWLVRFAGDLAERISAALKQPVEPTDLIVDAPPPHREIEFAADIYFPKEDVYRPLQEVSPVIDALAHRQFDDYVKRVRVFAHPAIAAELQALPEFNGLVETCLDLTNRHSRRPRDAR
jgi:HD superfamily phosphohydrolase